MSQLKMVLMSGDNERQSADPIGPDLAEQRAEVTRQAIREAVAALLLDDHPAAITVPAVASKAGVSVRTVYRYFPTKQALLDDVAEIQMRRADALTNGRDDLIDDPGNYLRVLWRDFATDVEAIRAQHLSSAGSDLRHRRLEYARGEVQDRLAKAFPDTIEADRALLADLLIAIPSSSMFLELHSRMGHDPDVSAELANWALRTLQRQFAKNGGFGRSAPPKSD